MDYLKPDIHASLILGLADTARQTGIPEQYLRHVGAKEYCSEEEMSWIRNVKKVLHAMDAQTTSGMLLYGKQEHSIMRKMTAIGATLVRNYIDARVLSLAHILELLDDRDSEVPNCEVLIIPDLCLPDFELPKRTLVKLNGLFLQRYAANTLIIGYVSSLSDMHSVLGTSLSEHIMSHFDKFAVNCTLA